MAIPLTAEQRAQLRQDAQNALDTIKAPREARTQPMLTALGEWAMDPTQHARDVLRLLDALDALDAREGQTCGTCRFRQHDHLPLYVRASSWCTHHDVPLGNVPTLSCHQWTPKEPQP